MINLQSSNGQMLDELFREYDKACYWLVKKYGGEKSYEKMQKKILAAATTMKKNVFTDSIEYKSAADNHWLVYECASYYPEAKASNTRAYAFCYYLTCGSIGVFVPVQITGTGGRAVLIFTSHFFSRLTERLGIRYDNPRMLRHFLQYIPQMLLEYNVKDDSVLVRFPNAVGMGVRRKGEEQVFEIRTVLSDAQLSNGQMRKTESLRERAGQMSDEPLDITRIRLERMNLDKDKLMKEMDQWCVHYQALGFKEDITRQRMDVYMWLGILIFNLGYADNFKGDFLIRFGTMNKQRLVEYADSGQRTVEGFIDLFAKCIRELGLKGFDRTEARQILDKMGAIGESDILISPKDADGEIYN